MSIILKYFLVPILTLFFVFFLKLLSRKREETSVEDYCVGIDVMIGCSFLLITEIIDKGSVAINNNLSASVFFPAIEKMLWLLITYLSMSLAMAYLIRKYGWEDDQTMKKMAANIANLLGALGQASLIYFIK